MLDSTAIAVVNGARVRPKTQLALLGRYLKSSTYRQNELSDALYRGRNNFDRNLLNETSSSFFKRDSALSR